MPELPEVEKMAEKLHGWCVGRSVKAVSIPRNPSGRYEPHAIRVAGKIEDVRRRGKYLVFLFESGALLLCHNAMSGFWDIADEPWTFDYVEGTRQATEKDVRVNITLDDDTLLRFHDARLFGRMRCFVRLDDVDAFKKMGPEAIETERTLLYSPVWSVLDSAVFLSDPKPIKQLLMEQDRIAGVGNIYASEALWRAKVHPTRLGSSLTSKEHQDITECVRKCLEDALRYDLKYDRYLNVYRREFCIRENCEEDIQKVTIAGRSSYFCPNCQRV